MPYTRNTERFHTCPCVWVFEFDPDDPAGDRRVIEHAPCPHHAQLPAGLVFRAGLIPLADLDAHPVQHMADNHRREHVRLHVAEHLTAAARGRCAAYLESVPPEVAEILSELLAERANRDVSVLCGSMMDDDRKKALGVAHLPPMHLHVHVPGRPPEQVEALRRHLASKGHDMGRMTLHA
jgi:hypothetical protein